MSWGRFLLVSFSAALLAACGSDGVYYEKPQAEVISSVKKAVVPTNLMGRNSARTKVSQPLDNTVLISITDQNGTEQSRLVAQIEAEGEGSRVIAQLQDADGKAVPDQMAQKAATEIVAAAVEGRAFDMTFASPAIAKAMFASNPEIQKRINAANETATAFAQMEQDMAEQEAREKDLKEYGDGWGENTQPVTQ